MEISDIKFASGEKSDTTRGTEYKKAGKSYLRGVIWEAAPRVNSDDPGGRKAGVRDTKAAADEHFLIIKCDS